MNVLGWEQSYNPKTFIDEHLTQTESGLYFQGAHPLLTLDNMQAIMPDDWGLQYPEWNLILPYKAGQKVKHNNIFWIAKIDNTGRNRRRAILTKITAGTITETRIGDHTTFFLTFWKD